ncbi:MAG: 2-dehydropantoate 2-reductase N-terminal domain-containing protein, partial [Myxococcota bacterium]
MNVLLVGAGAVGQVYGRHLQRGGAEIGFFVRPEYKDDVRSGMTLYPLSEDGTATTLRTSVVKTDIDDLADEGWEQIWLCTSSPALWSGPEDWITRLVAAAPQATIVSLQPGYQASRYLAERVPAARLVTGLIAFIAWQAPLPGETADPPGIRYWLPPMTPSPFMGPARLVDPIVETLQQGGIRASRVNNLASQAILPTAALSSAVSGLEI